MLKIIKGPAIRSTISTQAEGWQISSWEVARGKAPFAIRGIGESHHAFIGQLALAYGYKVKINRKVASFFRRELLPARLCVVHVLPSPVACVEPPSPGALPLRNYQRCSNS